jgi:hypothetical protein
MQKNSFRGTAPVLRRAGDHDYVRRRRIRDNLIATSSA